MRDENNKERIHLTFNLNDNEQKDSYYFLQKLKHSKTTFISYLISDFLSRNKIKDPSTLTSEQAKMLINVEQAGLIQHLSGKEEKHENEFEKNMQLMQTTMQTLMLATMQNNIANGINGQVQNNMSFPNHTMNVSLNEDEKKSSKAERIEDRYEESIGSVREEINLKQEQIQNDNERKNDVEEKEVEENEKSSTQQINEALEGNLDFF